MTDAQLNLPPLFLVADDDPMIGLLYARGLDPLGVQVLICDSARRAAPPLRL